MFEGHEAGCKFAVVMEGIGGNLYRTVCDTVKEAVELERRHRALGWNAWIETEEV